MIFATGLMGTPVMGGCVGGGRSKRRLKGRESQREKVLGLLSLIHTCCKASRDTCRLDISCAFIAFKMLNQRDDRDMHAKEQFIISHAALCSIPLALSTGDAAVASSDASQSDRNSCSDRSIVSRCLTLPGNSVEDSDRQNYPNKTELSDLHDGEVSKHLVEYGHHAHGVFDSDDDFDYHGHHHWHPHESNSYYS